MPPYKFDENTKGVEYKLPTLVNNNEQLVDYYDYLKQISVNMGSITKEDLAPFYNMMTFPRDFSTDKIEKLFGLLTQFTSAEKFQDPNDAKECMAMIDSYKTEME